MPDDILDVDLLVFESGDAKQRAAVVDGVIRSLASGFVYTAHDLSTHLLDDAYGKLAEFFSRSTEEKEQYKVPGSFGQTGYAGVAVEDPTSTYVPDWKEMLNWGLPLPDAHPLKVEFPRNYCAPVLPEAIVPGIEAVLLEFHTRIFEIQRRFLRIIAVGLGCTDGFFDEMVTDGPTLSRAIRYPTVPGTSNAKHGWAGAHADINLITALPRATAKGLQVRLRGEWLDVAPPDGQMVINTGLMLERLTNGVLPPGLHRVVGDGGEAERLSVVQFCHPTPTTILSPISSCVTSENPLGYSTISAATALKKLLWEINLLG